MFDQIYKKMHKQLKYKKRFTKQTKICLGLYFSQTLSKLNEISLEKDKTNYNFKIEGVLTRDI